MVRAFEMHVRICTPQHALPCARVLDENLFGVCQIALWALTKLFSSFVFKYSVEGLYSLYSIRVGGARAARASCPLDVVKLLGRWKDQSTAEHYLSDSAINSDSVAIEWPLIKPKLFASP